MNHNEILSKFTNLIMRSGKKSVASKILRLSLEQASKQLDITTEHLLDKSLLNVKPLIDARSKKVGRTSYIIPYAITEEQSTKIALKILIQSARDLKEKRFVDRLSNEFIDAANNRGASIKKRSEIHKLAEANKSFAYFR